MLVADVGTADDEVTVRRGRGTADRTGFLPPPADETPPVDVASPHALDERRACSGRIYGNQIDLRPAIPVTPRPQRLPAEQAQPGVRST